MELLKLNFFKRKRKNEEEITNFKKRQVKVLKFTLKNHGVVLFLS